jgi:hypothetical protein
MPRVATLSTQFASSLTAVSSPHSTTAPHLRARARASGQAKGQSHCTPCAIGHVAERSPQPYNG